MKTKNVIRMIYLLFLQQIIVNRIIKRSNPPLQIKMFTPPQQERRLFQMSKEIGSNDYDISDDSILVNREEFIKKYKSHKNKKNKNPMPNIFISRRVLEDGEKTLPPFEEEFKGIFTDIGNDTGLTMEQEGEDSFIGKDENGNPIVEVKMQKIEGKSDTEHNINVFVQNFKQRDEFEKKMMEGMSFIESSEEHRDGVKDFIITSIDKIKESNQVEEEGVESETLAQINETLNTLVSKVPDFAPVVQDEEFGYLYEMRSKDDSQLLLALVMLYPIGDGIFMIKIQTRLMEQFELQITKMFKMQDETAFNKEFNKLIAPVQSYQPIKAEQIAEKLQKFLDDVKSNDFFKDICDSEPKLKSNGFTSFTPGMVYFSYSANSGLDDMFSDDEDTSKTETGPQALCLLENGFVSVIDIIDMPYIFVKLSNIRMSVENFLPAIKPELALEQLESFLEKFITMNIFVETEILKKLNKEVDTVMDIESVVKMIQTETSGLNFEEKNEGDIIFFKENSIPRVIVKKDGKRVSVRFNFPNDAFKGKENEAPLTNEFVFDDKLNYDPSDLFKETLTKFVTVMNEKKL